MPGSFDLDTSGAGLSGYATPIAVYAYDPAGGYSLVPNVVPLRVDRREGLAPSAARFGYLLDDAMAATFGWPSRFEQLFGLYVDAANPYVVLPDQRLVVLGQYPDGSPWVLWDGFAQVPQMDVTRASEGVTFAGVGVEVRCWDAVITGRIQRDSDPLGIADTTGDSDVSTDLRPRFNPSVAGGGAGPRGGSLPNRSPSDTADPDTGLDYPVFVDPGIEGRDPDPRQYWAVGPAVRYVLGTENGAGTFVQNPPFGGLDNLLQTYQTAPGFDVLDPSNPASYVVAPAQVPDLDVSGQPWPEAVSTLVAYCGFLARFDTYTDFDGAPQTVLTFYRRDEFATTSPKAVYLDVAGANLDLTTSDAQDIHLSMDINGIVNAYEVETAQRRTEVSWVLAPLYQPAAADATAAGRRPFLAANLVNAAPEVARKYRWYGADECGAGHWTGAAWSTVPCDFDPIFPPDPDTGNPTWTVRYRPGTRTLISTDPAGRPLKADLSISFDYAGPARQPWDGTGTWQSISGGWRLLEDRLGIEVTAEDPENWGAGQGGQIAAAVGGGAALAALVPGGGIRGITWWANPPSGAPTNGRVPVLRLTTVIDDDLRMPIAAPKRSASPTAYPRWRLADRRDVFEYTTVDPSSINYPAMGGLLGAGAKPLAVRDDTDAAQALAEQLRGAHEFPTLAGSVTIPYLTDAFAVGDRIAVVAGRDCVLQTNIAGDQGEAPVYPWVVGVSWNFDGGQSTTLTLSDRRALPTLPLVSYRRSRR